MHESDITLLFRLSAKTTSSFVNKVILVTSAGSFLRDAYIVVVAIVVVLVCIKKRLQQKIMIWIQ